jgi:hypothetical protein
MPLKEWRIGINEGNTCRTVWIPHWI